MQGNGFNLSAIIRQDLLKVKKVAQNNQFIAVGAYFDLLYKFKKEGPNTLEALGDLARKTNGMDGLRVIQDMRELLEEIGCVKWPLILSDVISAVMKGNTDLSADCAKSILEPFNSFYNKLVNTEYTRVQPDFFTTTDDAYAKDGDSPLTLPLIQYLDRLEREESDRKLRILVVDDSTTTISAVFSALNNQYKVYGMSNPMMLEKFLEQVVPELFILDYKMPERTGFELIPIIRSFEDHKNTPIIILTAMGSIDHISASHSLGACDFIVKPFKIDILHRKIARHIKKKNYS